MTLKPLADLRIVETILDSLPMGVYVLDQRRRVRWVNARVMHRLDKDGFVQSKERHCYKEIFKLKRPCRDCAAIRTLQSGRMEHSEIVAEYKGETRHYLVTTALLGRGQEHGLDLNEHELFIIETIQDITYHRKAEDELRRINDFDTAIIQNAPVAIFTIDTSGKFTSVNPALGALSGLGPEAEKTLLGFNWIENSYTVKCGLADHIKRGLKGEAFELQDFPFITYRGKTQNVFMHFRGVPLRGKTGKVEGLLCIIEDTTEKVKAKMELIQNAKMSVIARLMTGVAHELNNPLATIAANSEFAAELLDGVEGDAMGKSQLEELKEYLETIQEQAFRCKNIINDMIDITKKSGVEVREIDLKACLGNLLSVMNFKKQKIHLIDEIAPDLPAIKGDLNAVKQCFMNIFQNAKDAVEGVEDKQIRVRAYECEQAVRVEIADSGIGIHQDILDKIFEPFFSTKDTGKGVGLGLTLCYELINRMGGSIEVDSAFGKGTVFAVTLPLFSPKQQEARE